MKILPPSKKNQAYRIFSTIFVLFVLFCMIISPLKFISQALSGISAWGLNVLPSVLPFMFFTKLLSTLDCMPLLTKPFLGLSNKFFKTPPISIYAFSMAILSGYPVGAKIVADLYLQRKISQEEAFKMTAFCSTSGPMFIVGAVGIGMFGNSKIGYILFLSHLIGAILNGVCFRNYKIKKQSHPKELEVEKTEHKNQKIDLSEIITNSTLSILSVGCIITIFFIIIECFSPLFSLLPHPLGSFLQGIIEITKGCIEISQLSSPFWATILCSFVISFGGISTILQSITMLSKTKMPIKLFVFQKFLHGIFSCLTTIILLVFFCI